MSARAPRALNLLLPILALVGLCVDVPRAELAYSGDTFDGPDSDEADVDADNYEEVGGPRRSGLRWQTPRVIVRELNSTAATPLCPLLDGSWRTWLQRQYSSDRDARNVHMAQEAAHCHAAIDLRARVHEHDCVLCSCSLLSMLHVERRAHSSRVARSAALLVAQVERERVLTSEREWRRRGREDLEKARALLPSQRDAQLCASRGAPALHATQHSDCRLGTYAELSSTPQREAREW